MGKRNGQIQADKTVSWPTLFRVNAARYLTVAAALMATYLTWIGMGEEHYYEVLNEDEMESGNSGKCYTFSTFTFHVHSTRFYR